MNGFIQAAYFFAESVSMCGLCDVQAFLVLAISLFCGTISAMASMIFVKRIYKNIKVD